MLADGPTVRRVEGADSLVRCAIFGCPPMKIAVQLYTLRSLLEKDTYATLRRLTDMGFKTAELAGTYGKPADEFAEQCKTLGLQIIAPHMGIEELEQKPQDVAALCRAMGR